MFAAVILKWFSQHGRNLPWRETRDPYAIWLSEIILQQTRISQGWVYWERFMQAYPKVEDLAAAEEDEVLKLWQGLGYYSRARNLHAAAKQVVALGGFPHTLEGLKSLKGVGDYTAAAIASIAFDLPAAVVDGNVYRVLARYFGISTPINTTQGKKEFFALAQSLLPPSSASAFNQGMMDFGALQCTPLSPQCLVCPLAETCVALREGKVELLPVKQRTLKVKTLYLAYIYIRCQGKVALHRRGKGDIWQGLWEPFNASLHEEQSPASLAEIADQLHLSDISSLQLVTQGIKHVLTHRILLADFYFLTVDESISLPADYIWVSEEDIDLYAVPRLIEIMFEKISSL